MQDFARRLIRWQKRYGRQDLPWQGSSEPYRIWVAEIMLQQTQVTTVIPYYRHFLERFPDLFALAEAPLDAVLACFSGLGYYARARYLHRAARLLVDKHGGMFPRDLAGIAALPGIGRSTAAAIAVFAYGAREAILDGNVKRVLCRVFAVEGWPGEAAVERRLWQLAESLLPAQDVAVYTQALMDLGATVCTPRRPLCAACPVAELCRARREERVELLPTPRPRKALPQRETGMLVLLDGDEVLLEKRPAMGLWGGLWCLPETRPEGPRGEVARLAQSLGPARPLAAIAHGFTHFRLLIRPYLLPCRRLVGVEEGGRQWVKLSHTQQLALPAPVSRLLATLGERCRCLPSS